MKHPEFTKSLNRALQNPAVRTAYEAAKARADKGAICDVAGCERAVTAMVEGGYMLCDDHDRLPGGESRG